jgi:hypothetical protein
VTVTFVAPVSYDLAGAAAATGLSERTIRDAIASSDLIAHYSGTKPVLRVADLDEWIESLPTTRRGKEDAQP